MDQTCSKKVFLIHNKVNGHYYGIRHIEISLGIKFDFKSTVLFFWIKLAQKGCFQSKAGQTFTSMPSFILNRHFHVICLVPKRLEKILFILTNLLKSNTSEIKQSISLTTTCFQKIVRELEWLILTCLYPQTPQRYKNVTSLLTLTVRGVDNLWKGLKGEIPVNIYLSSLSFFIVSLNE